MLSIAIFLDILLYHYNSDTHVGGSAIYVSNDIKCRQLSQIKVKTDECKDVWVELILDNKETSTVGSVYNELNKNGEVRVTGK